MICKNIRCSIGKLYSIVCLPEASEIDRNANIRWKDKRRQRRKYEHVFHGLNEWEHAVCCSTSHNPAEIYVNTAQVRVSMMSS